MNYTAYAGKAIDIALMALFFYPHSLLFTLL